MGKIHSNVFPIYQKSCPFAHPTSAIALKPTDKSDRTHLWEYSSFHQWVKRGKYGSDWGCCCGNNFPKVRDFQDLEGKVGE